MGRVHIEWAPGTRVTARLRWQAWWSYVWRTGYPQSGDAPFRTWAVFHLFRAYRRLVGRPVPPFATRPGGPAWRSTDQMPGLFVRIGWFRVVFCDCVIISQEPVDPPPMPT